MKYFEKNEKKKEKSAKGMRKKNFPLYGEMRQKNMTSYHIHTGKQ